mgnify:FL=1
MGKVAANFRIDKETKQKMKKICKDIEISTGAAFNIFAKKFTRERKILFELIQTLFIGDFLEILFVCFASSSIEYMSLFFGFSKKILFRNMLGIIFIGIIIYLVYILLNYLKYKKIKENNLNTKFEESSIIWDYYIYLFFLFSFSARFGKLEFIRNDFFINNKMLILFLIYSILSFIIFLKAYFRTKNKTNILINFLFLCYRIYILLLVIKYTKF